MALTDYLILLVYGAGILFIGSILAKKNQTSADMFAVRKQSPWWLSGLSAFMSAFSAGTFVVWGGIAYKQGLVAVSILMCSGIASFLVGKLFAGKWASLNIGTVGEYVLMRFGAGAVQFYTWIGMIFKIIAMGVALYSFAVVVSSLVPLPATHLLADPQTGKLSVQLTVIISGILMLMYAVGGGLWAVLIIDAIQFVVLTVTVLFVVPLSLGNVGGLEGFLDRLPQGFLSPASGNFTSLFLIGWIIVHTFKLGGEWVFVQRFLSVSSPADARKSANLVGVLYVVSPLIWMLPPMIFRINHPGIQPEQAYILACADVLPPGMIGLLIAAMFSSAASYIDGEVNVYAAAVTNDVYRNLFKPEASEKNLLKVGRISSLIIGLVIIAIACCIPYFGGAEKIIVTITGLLVVAMVLPVLWGLYFGRIKQNSIWYSTGLTVLAAILLKTAIPEKSDNTIIKFYLSHVQVFEVFIGVLVPVITLVVLELKGSSDSPGFEEVSRKINKQISNDFQEATLAEFPARLLAYSIAALALIMFGLMLYTAEHARLLIGLFAGVLLILSSVIFFSIRIRTKS